MLLKSIGSTHPAEMTLSCAPMGRRRQVSDREISVAAREVFIDRGPKAPVAMVAKKLGVSTATLFQRTGSKQQLMLMAFTPEGAPVTELARGIQAGIPVREQLSVVLLEINEYLGAVIAASVTLRAACIEASLPAPTPMQVRAQLAAWLAQAAEARLLTVVDAPTTADILIGAIEARHIHSYMQQQHPTSQQHRDYIRSMLDVVFPGS
jgi:AcrR family transcriptional regulator